MLKGRAHLEFKTELIELGHHMVVDEVLGYATDIVEGVIAEAGEIMELALVDGLIPVDFKDMFHDGGNLVDVISIEGDDAQAEDVGDIAERVVFGTLQFEFATERLLGLDAVLDGIDVEPILFQGPT